MKLEKILIEPFYNISVEKPFIHFYNFMRNDVLKVCLVSFSFTSVVDYCIIRLIHISGLDTASIS